MKTVEDFQLNSRCLAYHGPLLYEARIIKLHEPNKSTVEVYKGEPQTTEEANLPKLLQDQYGYFIHYKGWKATWDEWVNESRVMNWTIDNLKLQKELKTAALKTSQSISTSASSSKRHSEDTPGMSSSKRTKKHNSLETEDEFLKRPEISIYIPDNLKSLLVDDWEFVTKENQLVALPAKVTVSDTLLKYSKHKNKANNDILQEILSGLKIYFNRALPSILLYKFERQQYMDIMALEQNESKEPTDIYGPEHLLRLFVSLPGLIAQTSMDQQSIGVLKEFLEDFMKFMDARHLEFFTKKYENTTPAYESVAKN